MYSKQNFNKNTPHMGYFLLCGRGEIRTPEGLSPLTVFKTVPLDHSGTLPNTTLPYFEPFFKL